MKSFGWSVYLLVFFFSAIYVYIHNKSQFDVQIFDGYVSNFSINRGDDLIFYINPKPRNFSNKIYIYNIRNQKIDSLTLDLVPQKKMPTLLDYQNGFDYSPKYIYNTQNLKAGIYLISNSIPFIVKEPSIDKYITVVYPFGNLMALSPIGGKSFDPDNSSDGQPAAILSLHRPLNFNWKNSLFLSFIDSVYGPSKVNYISDLDLSNYQSIAHTKLLVLFGYSAFWTQEQRENFDKFQDNGGNVLAINTYLMNNKYLYFEKKHQISFLRKNDSISTPENRTGVWKSQIYNYPNTNSVGCTYETKSFSKIQKQTKGYFAIVNKNSPIFKNVTTDTISIKADDYNSLQFNLENQIPVADNRYGDFYSKEILAYDYLAVNDSLKIGGIYYMMKEKDKGKLIVISTDFWVNNKYFRDTVIQKVTKNAFDYLIQ